MAWRAREAGDIVLVAKLHETTTMDTLSTAADRIIIAAADLSRADVELRHRAEE